MSHDESSTTYVVEVYAAGETPKRHLGHVAIKPGPVAPGHLAAVYMPSGRLLLRRISYERGGTAGERVRLESLSDGQTMTYALSAVRIAGTVMAVCGVEDDCDCERQDTEH